MANFLTSYKGVRPDKQEDVPSWMDGQYNVWFRDPHLLMQNLLSNPDFDGEFDYVPYKEYDPNNDRWFQNFFSGDWVWEQAVRLQASNTGSRNCHSRTRLQKIPQHVVQPLSPSFSAVTKLPFLLPQAITNITHSMHQLATSTTMFVVPIVMVWSSLVSSQYPKVSQIFHVTFKLLMEAATKQYKDDTRFRKFRRQVPHSSLAQLLSTLKPGMTTPEVKCCPDGHFRHVIYGLGPYIADYPEQVFLSCCVLGWCPKYVFLFFSFFYSF